MAQVRAVFSIVSGHLLPILNGKHQQPMYRFKDMWTNLDIRSMHMIPDLKGDLLPILCAKYFLPLTLEQRVALTPVAGYAPILQAAKDALATTAQTKPGRDTILGALVLNLQSFNFQVTPPFPPSLSTWRQHSSSCFQPQSLKGHQFLLNGTPHNISFNVHSLAFHGVTADTHASMEVNPLAIEFPANRLHTTWKRCSEMGISFTSDIGETAQEMLMYRWRLKPIGCNTSAPMKLILVLENLAIPGKVGSLDSQSGPLKKLLEGPGCPVFELWTSPNPIQWCAAPNPPPLLSGMGILPWIAMGQQGEDPSDYIPLSDDMIRR